MNIITGTINPGRIAKLGILLFLIIAVACTSTTQNQKTETTTKSDVKIISPATKNVEQSATYKGTTRYLQTNTFRSPVSGIVKAVKCQIAGIISNRQPLFIIQPMEAAALQKSNFNDQDFDLFQDTIYSPLTGTINKLNVQVGDYVQIGDVLANCIRTNSLRILIDVPTEQLSNIRTGMNCTILLPGGQKTEGHVIGQWPSATGQNQTQPFIVKPLKTINLSENINLSVQFKTGELTNALLIPKNALQGNEMQTSFWVVKLVNDTTCIKIPVTKGLETDSLVQLVNSGLSNKDRLVSEGGYGLPDTATVRIIKNESQAERHSGVRFQ